jgi:hypothetical protein
MSSDPLGGRVRDLNQTPAPFVVPFGMPPDESQADPSGPGPLRLIQSV